MFAIEGIDHQRFPRAFELINKTNQFNTTGRRWTTQECVEAFANGSKFVAFEVEDKFTAYGLVGVIVMRPGCVDQFVMSCRVVGMEVEIAALSQIISVQRSHGADSVEAALHDTELNLLCRDLYQRCGFSEASPGKWTRWVDPLLPLPSHIEIAADESLTSSYVLA
jgi:FkbH-like protein